MRHSPVLRPALAAAIATAAALTVAASVGLLWRRAPVTSSAGSTSGRPADDSADDVAALKRDVAALKKIAVAEALRPLKAAPTIHNDRRAADSNPAAHRLAPGEQRKALGDALEARFGSEPIDPSWSDARVQLLRETFARALPDIKVAQAACASTMCKVAVEHSDADSQGALMEKLSSADGIDAEIFYLFDRESNPPRTTLYVARPGHTLPRAKL